MADEDEYPETRRYQLEHRRLLMRRQRERERENQRQLVNVSTNR